MTKHNFGDVAFYQQRKELKERFCKLAPKLQELDQNYYFKCAVQRFRDVLNIGVIDPGKLPVFTSDGLSIPPKKDSCVLCIISMFVQDYWNFREGLSSKNSAESELVKLENIVAKGLDAFDIEGDTFPGYYLEEHT